MNGFRSFAALLAAQSFLSASVVMGQATFDYAVGVSAAVETNPAQVALSWPADPQATGYTVYRKSTGSTSWGSGIALPAAGTSYTDLNVAIGNSYEYRISKAASASGKSFTGEGYICVGVQAPLVDARGKIILLADDTFSSSLAPELTRLEQDLVGDGWVVLRHDVARTSTVYQVKSLVVEDYNTDPSNVKALFLLGHLPVPYSGNFAPDGHPEHVGAWPADVFYGDIDGPWTDSQVNVTTGIDSRNWNVPGDGKFDQSSLPSDVELQVGRVDMANLPSFGKSEEDLLRQYLNKDHNFRLKLIQAQGRGLVDDNFGTFNGEAFAVNGYRNFAPLFGAANAAAGDWLTGFRNDSYLWGYGCGPGSWDGAAGVGTTRDFAGADPQVVFTMLFGSYLGDWDSPDNFMRAALATPTYTLTCAWAGRPYWMFHHMGVGEPIGFSTRLSQNNSSTYAGGSRTRGVHVALMGDPTLRMHSVAPPADLVAVTNTTGRVELRWTASPDSVQGYHVYRAPSAAGPFTKLTTALLQDTTYTDTPKTSGVYMVRAVKLEVSSSGSYFNPSQGILQSPGFAPRLTLTAAGPGAYSVTGTCTPGHNYQLQARDGLTGSNWQTLTTVSADASGVIRYTDVSASPVRMYRLATP